MNEKKFKFEFTEDQAKIVLKALEHYVRWRDTNGFFGQRDNTFEKKIRETRTIVKEKVKTILEDDHE